MMNSEIRWYIDINTIPTVVSGCAFVVQDRSTNKKAMEVVSEPSREKCFPLFSNKEVANDHSKNEDVNGRSCGKIERKEGNNSIRRVTRWSRFLKGRKKTVKEIQVERDEGDTDHIQGHLEEKVRKHRKTNKNGTDVFASESILPASVNKTWLR